MNPEVSKLPQKWNQMADEVELLAPSRSERLEAMVMRRCASELLATLAANRAALSADREGEASIDYFKVQAFSEAHNLDYNLFCNAVRGMIAAPVAAKPEVLNVRDFGAVGDGVTDDTAAFQRACDAAKPVGVEETDPGSHNFIEGMKVGLAESEFLADLIRSPVCHDCGATDEKDAEGKCRPTGDSCPGCEWPLRELWALASSGRKVGG